MLARNESRREVAQVCLLLFLAFAAYANSLLNGFIYDDHQQILENPYVHSFRHLRAIFTTSVWSFQGAEGILSYYRPLMTFGYMLCWRLFGPVPLGYHIVSVAMNAVIVVLVFFLTRRLFQDSTVSFIAAAIFALHPVHTESVAWVAGVTDLELALFYLITFLLFLDVSKTERPGPWIRRILMAVSFSLALLSKEQAATLPVLATLYEHFYREDRKETSLREKMSRYGILWVLTGAYLLLRFRILGGFAPSTQRTGLSYYEAILSAAALVGQYMGKLLWPAHLALFYNFHKSTSILQTGVILGFLSLLVMAILFIWTGMWRPASFAVVWLLLTLAPVLNIRWMVTNVFAERYLYLPSVGFCWLVAYGARNLWMFLKPRPAVWRAALACAMGALGILGGIKIFQQNSIWRDQETFVRRTMAASTDDSIVRANLGAIYWNKGDLASAEHEWLEAFKTQPDNIILLEDMALLRAKQMRYQEATDFFQQAIRQHPNYIRIYASFGKFYEDLGRTGDAEVQYRIAVRLAPLNVQARNNLGTLLFKEDRLAEAEKEFLASLDIDQSVVACDRLGDIYSRWGNTKQAEWAFAQAASLEPFDSHAHFGLGALYALRGAQEQAIREYEAGLQTDPRNTEALAALRQLKP